MRNLLARLLGRHRVFLLACAVVLGGFQLLFGALVAEMDLASALQQVLAFAPPAMRAMIEQSLLGGSARGVLAFGWNHPITHALLAAVAVTLAARAIAGEVESGVIELVLSAPLTRARYFAAHLVFGLGAITAVAAVGIAGTALGQHLFRIDGFGADRLLSLLLNVVLLQGVIWGVTLAASAFAREVSQAALAGVLFTLLSYLVSVIATLWPRAAFLLPWSLHGYYDPRALLVDGRTPVSALLVLATCLGVATTMAWWRFARRDLP